MPQIFLPSIPDKASIKITGENAKYLLTVLRLKSGDEFIVIDGKGNRYRAGIKSTARQALVAYIKETLPPEPEPSVRVILLQGILKGQKMDLIIQKAAELGVKDIVPVITERSQIRETRKTGRWRKIALEASRQCGRSAVPEVREPSLFEEYLKSKDAVRGFIFWEEGGKSLSDAFSPSVQKDLFVAIGPEGGFTKEEVRLAEEKGLIVCTLGRRILKAETAAISAVTLVQFMIGEMG